MSHESITLTFNIIEGLKKSNVYHDVENGQDRLFLKIPAGSRKNQKDDHHYMVDFANGELGGGCFGSVLKAVPFELSPNKRNGIIKNGEWVVKVFHLDTHKNKPVKGWRTSNKEGIKNEVAFTSRYYKTEPALFDENYGYFLMEFRPGDNVDKHNLSEDDFLARLLYTQQILLNLNLIHNHTPSTGSAAVHADIKDSNILLNKREIKDSEGKIIRYEYDADILDRGFMQGIEDNTKQYKQTPRGTPVSLPPEALAGNYSVKVDIASLTPVISKILGAEKPLKSRDAHKVSSKALYETGFDFDDILNKVNGIPQFDFDVKVLLTKLLARNQSLQDWEERPDSTKLLRFFTDLINLTKLYQHKLEDAEGYKQDKKIYLARMILIAEGFWNQNQNTIVPSQIVTTREMRKTGWRKDSTFAAIGRPLSHENQFAESIIALHKANLLIYYRSGFDNLMQLIRENFINQCTIDAFQTYPRTVKLLKPNILRRSKVPHINDINNRAVFMFLLDKTNRTAEINELHKKDPKFLARLLLYLYRDKVSKEFKDVYGDELYKLVTYQIASVVTQEISRYRDETQKFMDTKKNGDREAYKGFRWGFKIGDKLDSADLINNVLLGKKTVREFFATDDDTTKLRKALGQGTLKKKASDLVQLLQEESTLLNLGR